MKILSKITKAIKNLDRLGPNIQFNTGGKSSYQTLMGSFCTVLLYLILGAGMYRFTIEFLDDTNPRVRSEIQLLDYNQSLNISIKDGHFLGFILSSERSSLEPGPAFLTDFSQYATVDIKLFQTRQIEKNDNSEIEIVNIQQNFVVQKCTEKSQLIKAIEGKSKAIESIFKNFGNCATLTDEEGNPKEVQIKNSRLDVEYSFIRISVYPCSLPDPNNCKKISELKGLSFNFLEISKFIDYSKKDEFMQRVIDVENTFTFSQNMITQQSNYLIHEDLYDDDSFFREPKLRAQFINSDQKHNQYIPRNSVQIHCKTSEINEGKCDPYLILELKSSGKKKKIMREYPGILEVIGNIGGFAEIFTFIFALAYSIYHEFAFKKYLIKTVFNVSEKDFKETEKHFIKSLTKSLSRKKSKISFKESKILPVTDYKKIIEEDFEISKLFSQINKSEVFFSAIMQPFHVKLIPYVMVFSKAEKRKLAEMELGKRYRSKFDLEYIEEMTLEEAIHEFNSYKPGNDIERCIHEHFRETIPKDFFYEVKNQFGHKKKVNREKKFLKRDNGIMMEQDNNMIEIFNKNQDSDEEISMDEVEIGLENRSNIVDVKKVKKMKSKPNKVRRKSKSKKNNRI